MAKKNNNQSEVDKLKIFLEESGNSNAVVIVEDDNIIVEGSISIKSKEIKSFPVKFHELRGSLTWSTPMTGSIITDLQSLENFPETIMGDCNLSGNHSLKTLKGISKNIGGHFMAHNCPIEEVDGCPIRAYSMAFSNTKIKNLDYLLNEDVVVNDVINIVGTPIETDKTKVEALRKKFGYTKIITSDFVSESDQTNQAYD